MELLLPRRPRALLYVVTCGIAGGLGAWTFLPGIAVAAMVAVVTVDPGKRSRVWVLGLAGLLGSAVVGLMNVIALPSYPMEGLMAVKARLLLSVKAGIVGGLAGAMVGMAVSEARYRVFEALWCLPLAVFWAATRLLPRGPVDWLGWTKTAAVTLVLLLAWLHYMKRDRAGVLAGSLGAMGAFLGAMAVEPGWACYVAACAAYGMGVGLAVYCLDEGLEMVGPTG